MVARKRCSATLTTTISTGASKSITKAERKLLYTWVYVELGNQ